MLLVHLPVADADIITFTDSASFEAALVSFSIDTWSTTPDDTLGDGDPATGDFIVATVPAGETATSTFADDGVSGGTFGSHVGGTAAWSSITLDLGGSFNAFGSTWISAASGAGLDITAGSESFNLDTESGLGGSTGFFGFISTSGTFDTVVFTDPIPGDTLSEVFDIDDTYVGTATVVPEPSSFALLCAAGALAALRRRRD